MDKVPIRAWCFAASPATIPVETPLEVVRPSIFGKSPSANICGTAPILLFTGIGCGVKEWIV